MRTTGSVNKTTTLFNEQYDKLCRTIVDPVVVLFKLCRSRDQSIKHRAAATLISKRFPSQLAIKGASESQGELTFTWSDSEPDVANNNNTVQAATARPDTTSLN